MKKKDFMTKIRVLSVKELVAERNKLKKKLYDFKMKLWMKALKETHNIWDLKIQIARINTILKSKIQETYGNNLK